MIKTQVLAQTDLEIEDLKRADSSVHWDGPQRLKSLTGFQKMNARGKIYAVTDTEIRPANRYVSSCHFPSYLLNEGSYQLQFGAESRNRSIDILTPFCLEFSVEDIEKHGDTKHRLPGVLRPKLDWTVSSSESVREELLAESSGGVDKGEWKV